MGQSSQHTREAVGSLTGLLCSRFVGRINVYSDLNDPVVR